MRHLLLVVVLCLVGCGERAEKKDVLPAREAAKVLLDRNWLDVMPRHSEQRLHVFRFTSTSGGVYQDRTLFAGQFELFLFNVEDDRLVFELPHKRQRAVTHFHITKVHGAEPFDLKLVLEESPRGPAVYYGFSNERAEEADVAKLIEARKD